MYWYLLCGCVLSQLPLSCLSRIALEGYTLGPIIPVHNKSVILLLSNFTWYFFFVLFNKNIAIPSYGIILYQCSSGPLSWSQMLSQNYSLELGHVLHH